MPPIALEDPPTTTTTVNPKDLPPPTHPGKLHVHRSSKPFASGATSQTSLPAGSVFTPITGTTSSHKAYTSVQTGRDSHIELNSDLVYCNHSCAPTLDFDMHAMQVRVVAGRDLKVGDPLTFFYPSSEWEMDQAFECMCGAESCKGFIKGAKEMSRDQLKGYWLNPHITELLDERDARADASGSATA
ncbi:hypothetical protein P170DRAFT_437437 [Aspergillus steynii IBT 23096]|uniref:Post-SET domain-containing protein n=1 Tax=Aspergillus steynii IBT 23096 TaxID=1392250 RepID=A0A2I2G449_9EURO|nr:uncharacterized protein P170DRAFT_437437 [Aspergillus steynii IBT 23096]PLB47655.1 hypothetical protein P170DRAFT_437437 [Aspergillus steynii IBT 23096]